MNPNVCPKTWLAESILVTIFCCLPFGIVGILNAAKVSSLYAQGNYEQALTTSKNAKKWTIIGLFVGLAVIVIYMVVFGTAMFSAMN